MTTDPVAATAVIEEDVVIGPGSRVWDLAQVRRGAVIGSDCVIGRNVFIDAGVVIGDRCKVQNNVLLYAPARLADGVFVGPGAIVTNDRVPRAVDEQGRLKDAGGWTAAGVVIERGASIGAGAVVVAGLTVGAWAIVGAGAVVTRDVPSHALVVGNPAKRIGWIGRTGARLRVEAEGLLVCPDTGARFRVSADHLEDLD